MTEPTTRTPDPIDPRSAGPDLADDALPDGDIDVVPGDPPVPITVWRTPAGDRADLSLRLAARLLAAYTRAGEVVFDATSDPTFADAVDAARRRYAAPTTHATHDSEPPAALVLTAWPLPAGTVEHVTVLGDLRGRLAHRGVLAAVITSPYRDGAAVEVGPLVAAARAAGLSYLQHIVAVHARVHGDHIAGTPRPSAGAAAVRSGGGAHARVHTDLLIFARVGDHRG